MANVEIDRRLFLKLGLGGTALAGTASLGLNEAHILNSGIETANGVFMPLYEVHTNHVTPDKMPRGTNIYFTEITGISGRELFEGDPIDVVDKTLLDKKYILSENNTELMVGDVVFTEPTLIASFFILHTEYLGGMSIAAKIKNLPWQSETSTEENKRRKMVKVGAAALAYWLVSPVITAGINGIATFMMGFDYNNALARILNRVYALQQHFHPEHFFSVFRSLVMANKLLEVGKDYKVRTGQRGRIAFNVGGGHAQMEDFLQVGQDALRKLITMYPYPILKSSIDSCGGLDNFCTARMFRVFVNEGAVEVKERKVIDKELRRKLAESFL